MNVPAAAPVPATPAAPAPTAAPVAGAKPGKVVIPKKDFLDGIVRASLMKALEGGPNANLRLSRDRAGIFWDTIRNALVARAEQGPFSIRGYGSFYIVTGKDRGEGKKPNRYMRSRLKLKS